MRKNVIIIGGGVVGLNTAVLMARKTPYNVTIVDLNESVVESINSGRSPNLDTTWPSFIKNHSKIAATTSYDVIEDAGLVIIAVNTPVKLIGDELIQVLETGPLNLEELIDMKPLEIAMDEISERIKRGSMIILETTIYPGGTREKVIAPLEREGYNVGRDIFVAHVPERIDPGNGSWGVEDIPRVLGSPDEASRKKALSFLVEELGLNVHLTSSLEAAEMSKLYENTFRLVNIAYAQEFLMRSDVPPLDVINAVKTKPFGIKVFYPGPYAGGTCLVKDSLMFLAVTGSEIVRRALIINELTPRFYAWRIADIVRKENIRRVVFLGSGYKPGLRYEGDLRLNPVFRIFKELRRLINVEISIQPAGNTLPPVDERTLVIPWNYRILLEIIESTGGGEVGRGLLRNSPLRVNFPEVKQSQ